MTSDAAHYGLMGARGGCRLPILFMHVPKCGGSSVATLLRRLFRPRDVCPVPDDGNWMSVPADHRYALYCGHFSMDFVDRFEGGTKLLMLRDPLARVVSLYDYWRSYRWEFIRTHLPKHNGPALARSSTFSEFLDSPQAAPNIYNACAAQLLGTKAYLIAEDEAAATRVAIAALQRFDWIGTSEEFAASVARLSVQLVVRFPRVLPRENASGPTKPSLPFFEPVARTVPTDADRRRILEGNRVDIAVYEAARRLADVAIASSQVEYSRGGLRGVPPSPLLPHVSRG